MQTTLDLKSITCAECYNIFGVVDSIIAARRQDGKAFYCPLGHANVYQDSAYDRIKKENQNLKSRLTWAKQSEARALKEASEAKKEKAAIKGQLTKTRNRIANGVCPCCHRTFKQLAAHMTNKHPDFKAVVS
jgi:hypothetical protein